MGFAAAREVVITMDADMQDSPEEIPELYRMIKNDLLRFGFGMEKETSRSLFSKRLPSKMYNFYRALHNGIKLRLT